MKFKFDHDYHIHSHLSLCSSDPEQNNLRILQYAKDNGLSEIVLTNHFWDASVIPPTTEFYKKQNLEHIKEALPLPQDEKVRFRFGAETELDLNCVVATSKETFDYLDFVAIPTTHMHKKGLTISLEDYDSPDARGKLWGRRIDAVLDQELPFHKIGIAHPACPQFDNRSRQHYLNALNQIPTEDMERVFAKAAKVGVGIELNMGDMGFKDQDSETVLRMFRVAKAQGCKFYCGSDVHQPIYFRYARDIFERAIDMLGLTENDRFYIEK